MAKSSATVHTAGGNLRMEVDIIEIPYITAPAASWEFTDELGHEHYYSTDPGVPYPTLRVIYGATYWCEDCRDEHRHEHLECKICGEEIRPGVTGPGIERIPGRASYYLDDQPITPDEYARLLSEHQDGGLS